MGGQSHQEGDIRRQDRLVDARLRFSLLTSRAGCIDRHETVFYVSPQAGNLSVSAVLFVFTAARIITYNSAPPQGTAVSFSSTEVQ